MKKEPRGKFDKSKIRKVGAVELSADEHDEAVRQIAAADDECRVNFRWGSSQIEVVKTVAEQMGVSYQQYIKQVVYRQAQSDLQQFQNSMTSTKARHKNNK